MCLASVYGLLTLTGCATWQTTVWTEPTTETIQFDAAKTRAVRVVAHNGAVQYTGSMDPMTQATIQVTKKGGAGTQEEAAQALRAIEVFVEPVDETTQRIGYRWARDPNPNWHAQVSFSIDGPSNVSLSAKTHNGGIVVSGVHGEVAVEAHNGGVSVRSSEGQLNAETHNGNIDVAYDGSSVNVATHNGSIEANLAACTSIGGKIATHNGSISIAVSDKTSSSLNCQTQNGRVHVGPPLVNAEITNTKVSGTLGRGGQPLTVTTHNGGIKIQ